MKNTLSAKYVTNLPSARSQQQPVPDATCLPQQTWQAGLPAPIYSAGGRYEDHEIP